MSEPLVTHVAGENGKGPRYLLTGRLNIQTAFLFGDGK